jgi:hypothetical protein
MTGAEEIHPNFFIAGAPKSGTTSLYHYLGQHPQIYMSPVKEPHYFAPEIRLERLSERLRARAERDARVLREYLDGPMRDQRFGGPVTEWQGYLKLFAHADGQKAIGEASVCYLWSESAAANIQGQIPNARIIVVLRNPTDMAFSMYLQSVRGGALSCTFRQAIEMGLAQRGGLIDVWHPFLDLGLYSEQIRRFLKQFGREQVRIYWYEDYSTEPSLLLADIFRLLGVDEDFSPDMSKRYLEAGRPDIALDAEDRAFLTEFYREDIRKLADLLERDLSGWLA